MESARLNIAATLTIFVLMIVGPGPNFILVVNTSLADSRRSGLLTNPKAWAFCFSRFTLVAAPTTPPWAKAFLNLACS